MPFQVLRTLCALLVILAAASQASANENQPLECPQCGTWDVIHGTPFGAAGNQIVVSAERIVIPTCGEFVYSVEKKTSKQEDPGLYRYLLTLGLRPMLMSPLCGTDEQTNLRADVEISAGYRKDGSVGNFKIYPGGASAPSVEVSAWNMDRDDPCATGSSGGSAACMQIANARLYSELAHEAYGNATMVKKDQHRQPMLNFNPARFAAATLEFCVHRERNNGGGNWPYVWALGCQASLFQTKLGELRSWKACQSKMPRGRCVAPKENIDRSAKPES